MLYLIILIPFIIILGIVFILQYQLSQQKELLIRLETRWHDLNLHLDQLREMRLIDQKQFSEIQADSQKELTVYRENLDQHQIENLKALQESVQKGLEFIGSQFDKLTESTEYKLKEISTQVEQRLSQGFEHTTATFTDIIKRLALIDEAQKRITELSSNIVDLQSILADKGARGAFGEVQLHLLLSNTLPESGYSLQHTLSNNTRVDCLLFLPAPTGKIAIDAKFPLENYRRMLDKSLSFIERQQAEKQFRVDIRKHIQDVAQKYILPKETADGALLFIPAEAVFAEIHSRYYDLVEESHRLRVWLASPSTMMAILTTASAVLKDAATREQVHIIQKYLSELGKDFQRFEQRMKNLAKHIDQAHGDIQEVHISAQKITRRFEKIEKVELET